VSVFSGQTKLLPIKQPVKSTHPDIPEKSSGAMPLWFEAAYNPSQIQALESAVWRRQQKFESLRKAESKSVENIF
jgi:hypothetical protein